MQFVNNSCNSFVIFINYSGINCLQTPVQSSRSDYQLLGMACNLLGAALIFNSSMTIIIIIDRSKTTTTDWTSGGRAGNSLWSHFVCTSHPSTPLPNTVWTSGFGGTNKINDFNYEYDFPIPSLYHLPAHPVYRQIDEEIPWHCADDAGPCVCAVALWKSTQNLWEIDGLG